MTPLAETILKNIRNEKMKTGNFISKNIFHRKIKDIARKEDQIVSQNEIESAIRELKSKGYLKTSLRDINNRREEGYITNSVMY